MGIYTLITGASTGLGKELAIECAKKNQNILLVSLANEGLEQFSKELIQTYHIAAHYLEIDLTQYDAAEQVFRWVDDNKYRVNILMNNAGMGGSMPFADSPLDYINAVISLNIRATTLITKYFLPLLKKETHAHILFISSMASYLPIPYKSIYPASKAYVSNFAQTLRTELSDDNIGVTVVNPGSMLTNEMVKARIAKFGKSGKYMSQLPNPVARKAIKALYKKKPILIPALLDRINLLVLRIIPMVWRLQILKKIYKKDYLNFKDIQAEIEKKEQ